MAACIVLLCATRTVYIAQRLMVDGSGGCPMRLSLALTRAMISSPVCCRTAQMPEHVCESAIVLLYGM
jgi:hypothetical protein